MRRVLKKIANDEKDLGDISTMADSTVVQVNTTVSYNQPLLTSQLSQVLFEKRLEMMEARKKK